MSDVIWYNKNSYQKLSTLNTNLLTVLATSCVYLSSMSKTDVLATATHCHKTVEGHNASSQPKTQRMNSMWVPPAQQFILSFTEGQREMRRGLRTCNSASNTAGGNRWRFSLTCGTDWRDEDRGVTVKRGQRGKMVGWTSFLEVHSIKALSWSPQSEQDGFWRKLPQQSWNLVPSEPKVVYCGMWSMSSVKTEEIQGQDGDEEQGLGVKIHAKYFKKYAVWQNNPDDVVAMSRGSSQAVFDPSLFNVTLWISLFFFYLTWRYNIFKWILPQVCISE